MDAFITAEARQAFGALSALSPGRRLFGILVGHKRGHRFIVEKAFPAAGFRFAPRDFFLIDELFAGRVLGFYASGDLGRLKARLRQPYAAGRMLLSVRPAKRGPAFKAFAIDFEGRFRVVPLPLIVEESVS